MKEREREREREMLPCSFQLQLFVTCVSRKTNLQRVVLVTMGCSIEILEAAGDGEAESNARLSEREGEREDGILCRL